MPHFKKTTALKIGRLNCRVAKARAPHRGRRETYRTDCYSLFACYTLNTATRSCFHYITELFPQIGLTVFIFKPLFRNDSGLLSYSYCKNCQWSVR